MFITISVFIKSGLGFGSRNEVAFVTKRDGEAVYILAIFADDHAYAQDGKIFPNMSSLVFDGSQLQILDLAGTEPLRRSTSLL
ncbi:MAG: hypothetical protein KME08_14015 [Aphanothece sp. CMT-3BRIN-NPC111]|jgi:hypothetical protein|nr:hypothetical protein [Aphanothece sp. CMT-3BRIN-NPC111]